MSIKGLVINVYRSSIDSSISDVSNSDQLLLVGPGLTDLHETPTNLLCVELVNKPIRGIDNFFLRPINRDNEKSYAFDGCFGYSTDSRFPLKHPIKIYGKSI